MIDGVYFPEGVSKSQTTCRVDLNMYTDHGGLRWLGLKLQREVHTRL